MASHIIYVHTTVPAPPEVVWDVLTDVAHSAEVFRSVRRVELLTDGHFWAGTRWREERNLFGHHAAGERHVVECEVPRRLVVETEVGRDVVRSCYRVTPFGVRGDRTRLAMTTRLDTSRRSGVGRLEWLLLGGHSYERTRRLLQRDIEDIEAEVRRRGESTGKHAA
ncbi:SRPBCC family protein [Nocardioides sp. SYSU DS0651]|uniref:SRPBCC family protein n=1 Tax=Nocardioides sp. SYSU DS0651 TaxID=3415955 RepID=UPI003F4B032B